MVVSSETTLSDLDPLVLSRVFQHLPIKEVERCGAVNRTWLRASRSNIVWQPACGHDLGLVARTGKLPHVPTLCEHSLPSQFCMRRYLLWKILRMFLICRRWNCSMPWLGTCSHRLHQGDTASRPRGRESAKLAGCILGVGAPIQRPGSQSGLSCSTLLAGCGGLGTGAPARAAVDPQSRAFARGVLSAAAIPSQDINTRKLHDLMCETARLP
jgi:hypothetical protein